MLKVVSKQIIKEELLEKLVKTGVLQIEEKGVVKLESDAVLSQ